MRGMILIAGGIAGWAACAAVMGIATSITTLQNALLVHAVAAPLIFGALASVYFRAFPDAPVLWTATAWLAIVVALDLAVVADLVVGSLAMFQTPLGTWIPFVLIFVSVVVVGDMRSKARANHAHAHALG